MALSLDFAFEGFRTIRERPRLIFLWGAVVLTGHLVAATSLIHYAGPAMAHIQKGVKPSDADLTETLVEQSLPGIALGLTAYLIVGAILGAAAIRAAA